MPTFLGGRIFKDQRTYYIITRQEGMKEKMRKEKRGKGRERMCEDG